MCVYLQGVLIATVVLEDLSGRGDVHRTQHSTQTIQRDPEILLIRSVKRDQYIPAAVVIRSYPATHTVSCCIIPSNLKQIQSASLHCIDQWTL